MLNNLITITCCLSAFSLLVISGASALETEEDFLADDEEQLKYIRKYQETKEG